MVSEDSHNPVVNQQDTHVKGTVIDSRTGEPIIGANIVVKGTTNGTITGVDGDYSLKAPVGSVLEISFIGYKTVTVKAVAGLQKIRLQEDSSLLDEVVVVGYGTQKKK
ncbi:MAG: carboxypeptidase-like regulatory domain-containing protein [Phocaeicola massiliensis]